MIGEHPTLDAAYGYIESHPSWPLFPVGAHKRPLIATGRDHSEHASVDPDTLRRWILVDFPGCGIGMPTGAASGTVVIDADAKHDGEALLAELEDALGPLPRERVVRTRSGGLHVYCAHPGRGLRVRSGAGATSPLGRLLCGAPGVDVRADGGIVVLPPSAGYTWIEDTDGPLPPLPPLWLAAIMGAGDPPPPPAPRPVRIPDDQRDRLIARAEAYLARVEPAISGQGGHATTYRAALALVRGFGLDAGTALALLATWNQRCEPPWSERELARKVDQAARARIVPGYLLGGRP